MVADATLAGEVQAARREVDADGVDAGELKELGAEDADRALTNDGGPIPELEVGDTQRGHRDRRHACERRIRGIEIGGEFEAEEAGACVALVAGKAEDEIAATDVGEVGALVD